MEVEWGYKAFEDHIMCKPDLCKLCPPLALVLEYESIQAPWHVRARPVPPLLEPTVDEARMTSGFRV